MKTEIIFAILILNSLVISNSFAQDYVQVHSMLAKYLEPACRNDIEQFCDSKPDLQKMRELWQNKAACKDLSPEATEECISKAKMRFEVTGRFMLGARCL